ncbi:hypothetical protein EV426DRAFT_701827 [Tirmania nivea]|nr:hypothetical protein EV426DRAFT_701827 [Tirmania nivea]
MNEIMGRHGTSKAVWEGFKAFALEPKNGLPASRCTLLGMQREDKEGDKAQKRFHYLLLDSLKKDCETETRDGLIAASRWRENNRDDLEVAQPRPIMVASATVQVVIVNPNEAADKNANLDYVWATATKKQLVGLKNVTIMEIVDAIKTRIPNGKYVRAIWGAVSKPPGDGGKLEDVEFITSDEDLVNFLEVAKGMYKPTMLQVEVSKDRGTRDQTPRPDDRGYFPMDKFNLSDDTYDPVVSDSENELYLMKFGKRKGKAWPRSDHGWEYERAKRQKRIARLMKHKKELKRCHRDGKGYVRARAATRAAGRYNYEHDDEKAAEAMAIAIFGKPEVGDFNDFDST